MITIRVALYRGSFHGLRDTGEPDWPPSPRRVLGALLAGAHALVGDDPARDRALATLRRVAATPPPVIDTPAATPLELPPTYAPKTWLPDTKGADGIEDFLDLSLVGMDTASRTLKPQDGVALAAEVIAFHVDLDCDDADLAALDAAARRVPYFGTSKDPADLSVTGADDLAASPQPPLERWYPDPRLDGHTYGWQPNTIDWFEANFQRIFGRDEAVTELPPILPAGFVQPLVYSHDVPATRVEFPISQLTRSVPNHRIPTLIRRLNDELDDALPGWRAFPLTISHEFAETNANGDGRCVGFGLTPADGGDPPVGEQAEAGEFLARYVALLREQPDGLIVGRSGALKPATWIGPADTWYSTTPLRAFADERVVLHELAAQLNGRRYGVGLKELALQRTPRIRRNGRWSNGDLADGLDQWWAELTVSEQIEGPLLLGAATDRGFGTFRPRS